MRFKNINVDIYGHVSRVLSADQCHAFILRVYAILTVIYFVYIFCHLTYVPVTIIGNTVYAKIMAGTVIRQGLSYKLCRMNNRITLYETCNISSDNAEQQIYNKYVAFEGAPNLDCSEKLPVVTCSTEELEELQEHTGLNNLKEAQNAVLQNFDKIDGSYSTSIDDITADIIYSDPIITIDKLTTNLYYVTTTGGSWLTRLIITDNVEPLQVNDIIVGFTAALASEDEHESDNKRILTTRENATIKLTRRALYYVEEDLNIMAYPVSKRCKESLIYGLSDPRPFPQTGVRIIHPFHLPMMWDPVLQLMIITTAVLTQ